MKKTVIILAAIATLISGCRNNAGIRGYWAHKSLDYDDYDAAQEQFIQFAEQAVQAPEADAFAAVDQLLKKAAQDTVTYLVYAEFINVAFSRLDSPCRNFDLFLHAADKALSSGILTQYYTEEYELRKNFCQYNRVGQKARIPQLLGSDGVAFDFPLVQRTLLMVVDQDCASCRDHLREFMTPEWDGTWLVALCCGKGPLPTEPGWDCYSLPYDQKILDTREAPYYFITSADGTIEQGYEKIL